MAPTYTTTQQELDELRAVHAETIALLDKVQAYLIRLPLVPATRQLCRELEEHVQSPRAQAQATAARLAVRKANARHATCYAPNGVPVLLLDMEGEAVTLSTEISRSRRHQTHEVQALLKMLRGPLTLEMQDGLRNGWAPSLQNSQRDLIE